MILLFIIPFFHQKILFKSNLIKTTYLNAVNLENDTCTPYRLFFEKNFTCFKVAVFLIFIILIIPGFANKSLIFSKWCSGARSSTIMIVNTL